MTKNKKLKKNFIWNSVGSTLYSFTSLAFLVIVTRISSLEEAGIFTFAFSNACVFLIIGSYAGRIFQVTEMNKKITESDFLYNRLFTIGVMILSGLLFGIIKGYALYKLLMVQALIIFKSQEALAEFYYGVMQKRGEIHVVGKSLLMKAILSVVAFLIAEIVTKNILIASISMTVVVLIVLCCYDLRKARVLGFEKEGFNWRKCKKLLRMGFFVFLLNILTQYLINAPKYAIDNVLPDSSQTIFGIVSMPATVMVLVSGFLVHPVIVEIKEKIRKKEYSELNMITKKICLMVAAIGMFCTVCGYFLGVPVFKIIYGVDTSEYRNVLVVMLFGATMYGVAFVLENVLISFRKLRAQALIFVFSSIVAFFTTRVLVVKEECFGGAKAYLVSMMTLMMLYVVMYSRVFSEKKRLLMEEQCKD